MFKNLCFNHHDTTFIHCENHNYKTTCPMEYLNHLAVYKEIIGSDWDKDLKSAPNREWID